MNFPHASQPRPGQEDLERSRLNGHGFRNVFEGEVCRNDLSKKIKTEHGRRTVRAW
jgi:hypothetical protein